MNLSTQEFNAAVDSLRMTVPKDCAATVDMILNQLITDRVTVQRQSENGDNLAAAVEKLTGERDKALASVTSLMGQLEAATTKLASVEMGIEDKVRSDLLKHGIRRESISLPKPSGEVQAPPNLTDLARMIKAAAVQ